MRARQLDRTCPRRIMASVALLLVLAPLAACGALGSLASLVQPPRFAQPDRPAEIRLLGRSIDRPAGGASVTLWLEVTNPNPFGFTLSTIDATLLLEASRAATGTFPIGLPLEAGRTSVVPLDLTISFADVPGLAGVLRQAVSGQPVDYQLDGTVGIDAGRFGQPTFGPMRLVSGELRTR
jgi:hypothetical protein